MKKEKKNDWMSINKVTSFVIIILSYFIFSQNVSGEEINNNQKETSVSIHVLESPLLIDEVKSPIFGNNLTTSKDKQTLVPETDLIIQIRDTRVVNKESWGLVYRLELFKNEKSEELSNYQLLIKKGKLKVDGKEVLNSKYKPTDVTISGNDQGQLVNNIQENNGETYQYIVNSSDIALKLPKGVPSGTYVATQTITLINSIQAD
ncbi:WxL domain-containing protein [Lactococcus garvieae]|uniref:WxL domain-containing protein n=1 Tax=Lactococcus garvieae TaxID=1363 RepID=UPI00254B77A4|nr:WxL domain-containing protein [Lactococcus garvieae]